MTNVANIRELDIEFHPGAHVQKPLTARFESFGEALFNWTNSDGYDNRHSKWVDATMARAFCQANEIPFASFDIDRATTSAQYFESDAWVYEFLEKHDYRRLGTGKFVKLDIGNRPISYIIIIRSEKLNVDAEISGAEYLTVDFYEAAKANLRVDETMEKKAPYAEVVIEQGMGGAKMVLRQGYIENHRIAHPEYYPYLEGGLEALIRDFMESDETVLILMGAAGTGKSSAIAAAAEMLNLMPIYAKKTEVVLADGFVQFVCQASDAMMTKVEGSSAKRRKDMFQQSTIFEREQPAGEKLGKEAAVEEEVRVPLIVVEDGDELIAPRNENGGNLRMAELLNETDGIGSNHTRKLVITTNLENTKSIDKALMRPGRCYEVVNCRMLTPEEAIAARKAAGLPNFEIVPQNDISLAEALRKPRKKIALHKEKAKIGF